MATPALPSAAQQSPSKITAVGQEDKEKNNSFVLKMRIAYLNLYNHRLSYMQSEIYLHRLTGKKEVSDSKVLEVMVTITLLLCVSLLGGLQSLHDKADAPAECTSHEFH